MYPYLLIVAISLLCSLSGFAQTTTHSSEKVEEILFLREQMPHPCQCAGADDINQCRDEHIVDVVYSNMQYPEEARQANQEGMVVIRYIINKEGKMEAPEIARSQGEYLDAEAMRLVQILRKQTCWIPGSQRDIPCDVHFNIPIKFRLK